ncbi:MAG: bifunctional DNA-formamidopyrimidine glycosylase/DNA-(apurinic or apyrimidinic site) lyase [Desulfovibrio sp.]|jgi:formamidopyrimidine-DNA glycosylase|nr:bifunctional DNA-formamidopyrimidine glycosylase/DNA-(apurinic or apyrimidinic site) lyase [Desulfovibrio sp.]
MPELPEVETIVRTLAPRILGKRIAAWETLQPGVPEAGAELMPSLRNMRITRVFRRAKLLLMSLSADGALSEAGTSASEAEGRLMTLSADDARNGTGELILAFHFKMTGRFFIHPEGTAPLKHTRLILDLDDGGRLFFDDARKFGYCRVMRPGDLQDWPFFASLGPEPLELSPEELAGHLASRFDKRGVSVKAALLDQTVIAGIGNIYADESLFGAGLDPRRPAGSVSGEKLLALAVTLQEILLRSIRECGSSIRDYRDALGNAGAFQNSFQVYGRKGERCSVCKRPLRAVRVAGRGTVYCPRCQK